MREGLLFSRGRSKFKNGHFERKKKTSEILWTHESPYMDNFILCSKSYGRQITVSTCLLGLGTLDLLEKQLIGYLGQLLVRLSLKMNDWDKIFSFK